jgi:hypothetical protein
MLDFCPRVAGDMLTAQGELDRPAGPDIHRKLPQPAAHSAGEPEGDLPQRPAEAFLVEPAMNRLEPVEQEHVAGTGALAAPVTRRMGRMLLHRELEKLALCRSAERTRNPGIEETHDRLEHPVGRKGVASMNPQEAPVEAEHHRTVGVGDDSVDLPQSERQQAVFESLLHHSP